MLEHRHPQGKGNPYYRDLHTSNANEAPFKRYQAPADTEPFSTASFISRPLCYGV